MVSVLVGPSKILGVRAEQIQQALDRQGSEMTEARMYSRRRSL